MDIGTQEIDTSTFKQIEKIRCKVWAVSKQKGMSCRIIHVEVVSFSGVVSGQFTTHVDLQMRLRNGMRRLASLSLCLENKMIILSKL